MGPAEPRIVVLPSIEAPAMQPLPGETRREIDDASVKRTWITIGCIVGGLLFLHYLYLLFRGPVTIVKEIEVPVVKKVAVPTPTRPASTPAQKPELFKALTDGVVDSHVVNQV